MDRKMLRISQQKQAMMKSQTRKFTLVSVRPCHPTGYRNQFYVL